MGELRVGRSGGASESPSVHEGAQKPAQLASARWRQGPRHQSRSRLRTLQGRHGGSWRAGGTGTLQQYSIKCFI